MNLPNAITLSRIPGLFLIAALMYGRFTGAATAAFLLFILAAASDWLDGYIARRRGLVTAFGKLMDALTDKIMVMGLVMALVKFDEIPLSLALITLCREFLITGLRMVVAAKGVVMPADRGGKSKTLTQLVALGFLLAYPMAERDWRLPGLASDALLVGQAVFAVGTALAVWSGWRYVSRYRDMIFG